MTIDSDKLIAMSGSECQSKGIVQRTALVSPLGKYLQAFPLQLKNGDALEYIHPLLCAALP